MAKIKLVVAIRSGDDGRQRSRAAILGVVVASLVGELLVVSGVITALVYMEASACPRNTLHRL